MDIDQQFPKTSNHLGTRASRGGVVFVPLLSILCQLKYLHKHLPLDRDLPSRNHDPSIPSSRESIIGYMGDFAAGLIVPNNELLLDLIEAFSHWGI